MDLEKLSALFPAERIEWRIGQTNMKGDVVGSAKAFAYVTNRAIMDRLDEVCGPMNWKNEFKPALAGVICGISIRFATGEEWVTKWDGSELPEFEPLKGALSGSMKRAGVHWGIGRYLYGFEATWVDVSMKREKGWNYQPKNQKKKTPAYYWRTPALPGWATPERAKPAQRSESEHREHVETVVGGVCVHDGGRKHKEGDDTVYCGNRACVVPMLSDQQRKKLGVLFREIGFDDERRRAYLLADWGRKSMSDLSKDEASKLIGLMENAGAPA